MSINGLYAGHNLICPFMISGQNTLKYFPLIMSPQKRHLIYGWTPFPAGSCFRACVASWTRQAPMAWAVCWRHSTACGLASAAKIPRARCRCVAASILQITPCVLERKIRKRAYGPIVVWPCSRILRQRLGKTRPNQSQECSGQNKTMILEECPGRCHLEGLISLLDATLWMTSFAFPESAIDWAFMIVSPLIAGSFTVKIANPASWITAIAPAPCEPKAGPYDTEVKPRTLDELLLSGPHTGVIQLSWRRKSLATRLFCSTDYPNQQERK